MTVAPHRHWPLGRKRRVRLMVRRSTGLRLPRR
jgi:hypothetical protein